ncbi:MAG TPA: PilZ domain-containing protein [Polyangiaceae bacterium]|nr:PilZ domain-containing protein [Polyangiaceae bacterium]
MNAGYEHADHESLQHAATPPRPPLQALQPLPALRRVGRSVAQYPGSPPSLPDAQRNARLIADPDQRRLVFESLCATSAAGLAFDAQRLEPLGRVQLCEDGTVLLAPGLAGRRLVLQVCGPFAAYRLTWEPGRGCVLDAIEVLSARVERRTGVSARVRFRYAPGIDAASVEPMEQSDTRCEATVLDVSSGGLAFFVASADALPAVGRTLEGCTITWKRGPSLDVRAHVVHACPHADGWRVGVRLEAELDVLQAWCEHVEGLQFSETARPELDAEQVWNAYADSGYLHIGGKTSAAFERGKLAFARAQRLLARAPRVGALFTGGGATQPEAYVHQVQCWPRSWLLYQLCRLPRGRSLRTSDDGILASLYEHCYAFVLAAGAEWMVTYTHASDTTYTHRLHYEHALKLAPHQGCTLPFEAIEISGVRGPSKDAFVGTASAGEIAATARALAARFPAPYLASTRLDRADLGLDDLDGLWRGSGLERRREVLVARRDGRAVAAAILDMATPGLHVYGLLDKVRLVELEAGGERAFDGLLAAAHERYVVTGHTSCVYFRELGAPAPGSGIEHASMGKANINVLGRAAAASFLEHVFLLLSKTVNHARGQRPSYRIPPAASRP